MEDDPHTPAQDATADENPEANDERTLTTRRVVLAALAVGAVGAVGETLRRSGSLDATGSADGFSFSPESLPPDVDRVLWIQADTGSGTELLTPDRLPVSWTASGLGWSVATDRRSAVEGLPQVPGVFVEVADDGSDADAVLVAPDSLPEVWTDGGAELVIDETLEAARTTHSGRTPAVLWGADHTWEVVVDE